jgi:hypothetical protein
VNTAQPWCEIAAFSIGLGRGGRNTADTGRAPRGRSGETRPPAGKLAPQSFFFNRDPSALARGAARV